MAEKRRDKGSGSFWQDKHGQWWAKATRDGRTLRARAADRADARQKAKALAAELAASSDIDTARMSIREWLTAWVDAKRSAGRKPSTLAFYKRNCEYMIPHIGEIALGRLEPRNVRQMLAALTASGELTPRSVAHVRAVLANSLQLAVKERVIRDNVARLTDTPDVERYEAHALAPDEQNRLIAAVDGLRRRERYGTPAGTRTRVVENVPPHRLAAFAHLALGLGLRRGELLTLAWRDVDIEGSVLIVRKSKTDAGTGRSLPLTAHLSAVLRSHKAAQDEEAELARKAAAEAGQPAPLWNAKGLVFCSDVGTPISESNFSARVFKMWLFWADLPETIRVHDLRHTFATNATGAGGDPKSVQTLMGHADPLFTLRIYAKAQAERLRPIVEAAEQVRLRRG